MFRSQQNRLAAASQWLGGAFVVCVAGLWGCSTTSPNYRDQRTFSEPTSAVRALAAAAQQHDAAQLEAILGSDAGQVLSSGDPVADRHQREVFALALDESWSIERIDSGAMELIVGHERWPFPIPLVKDRRGWWFDTIAGEEEVLARRIGRNELAAIGVLRTYVIAQTEYASESHDGKRAGIYAQKIRSEPGRHDGLYWPVTSAGEKPSPLGQFAAAASVEGYGNNPSKGPSPYHGYYFRILSQQGPNAPGGAKNYVAYGEMTDGFAMVAYPAEYGSSGIMSFIVGPDGAVYEANLGAETETKAAAIASYDPAQPWTRVEDPLGEEGDSGE